MAVTNASLAAVAVLFSMTMQNRHRSARRGHPDAEDYGRHHEAGFDISDGQDQQGGQGGDDE
jgi:hypothetical protein